MHSLSSSQRRPIGEAYELFVLHSIDPLIATGKLCCAWVCLEKNILKTYPA